MTGDRPALSEVMDPGLGRRAGGPGTATSCIGDFPASGKWRLAGATSPPAPTSCGLRRPMDDVRVLILGQDPYPTPGHAVGLSFAVPPTTRPLPKSLINIAAELRAI